MAFSYLETKGEGNNLPDWKEFTGSLYYEDNDNIIHGCYYTIQKEISGANKGSRKGKNMTTMNRNYYLYSESYESSLQSKSEWMLGFMRSFKEKQMRGNVVIAKDRIE